MEKIWPLVGFSFLILNEYSSGNWGKLTRVYLRPPFSTLQFHTENSLHLIGIRFDKDWFSSAEGWIILAK